METTTFDELREDFAQQDKEKQERERMRLIETANKDIAELRESLQPYGNDDNE